VRPIGLSHHLIEKLFDWFGGGGINGTGAYGKGSNDLGLF